MMYTYMFIFIVYTYLEVSSKRIGLTCWNHFSLKIISLDLEPGHDHQGKSPEAWGWQVGGLKARYIYLGK